MRALIIFPYTVTLLRTTYIKILVFAVRPMPTSCQQSQKCCETLYVFTARVPHVFGTEQRSCIMDVGVSE